MELAWMQIWIFQDKATHQTLESCSLESAVMSRDIAHYYLAGKMHLFDKCGYIVDIYCGIEIIYL
jgi:hypothetical protein